MKAEIIVKNVKIETVLVEEIVQDFTPRLIEQSNEMVKVPKRKISFDCEINKNPSFGFKKGLENVITKLNGNPILELPDIYIIIPNIPNNEDKDSVVREIEARIREELIKNIVIVDSDGDIYAVYSTINEGKEIPLSEYEDKARKFYNLPDDYYIITGEDNEDSPIHYWKARYKLSLEDIKQCLVKTDTDIFVNPKALEEKIKR